MKKSCHAAVSMGNKMFVIGGKYTTSCEVFDSFSRKCTKINSEIKDLNLERCFFHAFCIGNNIVVFQDFLESFTETVVY